MMATDASGLIWRQVWWPSPLHPDVAVGLLRRWAADPRSPVLVLESHATSAGVVWLIGSTPTDDQSSNVSRLVSGTTVGSPDTRRRRVVWGGRLRLSTRHRAIRDEPVEVAYQIHGALSAVKADEELVVQIVLGPRRIPLAVPNQTPSTFVQPWYIAAWFGSSQQIDGERRTALRNKVSDHGFAATIRLGVIAEKPPRRRELVTGLLTAMRAAQAPGVQIRMRPEPSRRLDRATSPWRWPLRLNVNEVLTLSGWPVGDESLPGALPAHPRLLRPVPEVTRGGVVVARSTSPGSRAQLRLRVPDLLTHLHAVGPTGTGKSTLLLNLIVQNMHANHGLVVVDPKGDLVNDVLARVPTHRVDDVVVLDPSDLSHPVGLNPLSRSGTPADVVADGVLAVFKDLYAEAWGPRIQDVLHAGIMTLARRDDASLVMLPLLLTNPGFRRSVTANLNDPLGLGPFWEWYEALSPAESHQVIAPVMSRLRALLVRPHLRNVLGQIRPKFVVNQVFTERKILLVNLSKGLLGREASALLGSLVVAQVAQAIAARSGVPHHRRDPVLVYIDEMQDYLHLPVDISEVLEQARSHGTGLVLAHQALTQLPGGLRDAVMANARSRVFFRLAEADAATIARGTGGLLTAEDFTSLKAFEVYASLMAHGTSTPFASGRTFPAPRTSSNVVELTRRSATRWGRPLDEVEAGFAALIRDDPAGPAGSSGVRRRRPT